jgi:hypothetical protein
MPITFLPDCTYGVYDLASRLMEAYFTNVAVYWQIKHQFHQFLKSEGKDKTQK